MKTFQEFLVEDLYTASPIKIMIKGKPNILFSDELKGDKFNPLKYMKSFDSKEVQHVMSQISYTPSREGYRFFILGVKNRLKHGFVWTSEILHLDMANAIDKEADRRNFPSINLVSLLKSTNDTRGGWWAFTGAYQPNVHLITDASITPFSMTDEVDFQTMFNLDDEEFERMFE